jgi:hypothetical protein
MTVVALVLLALTAAGPVLALLLRRRWADPTLPVAATSVVLLAGAAALAAAAGDVDGWRAAAGRVLAVVAATTAGSDVVRAVFRLVRRDVDLHHAPVPGRPQQPADALADAPARQPTAAPLEHPAGAVLRGGIWIGYLERAAVSATLLAGWPEGMALVLAVKGVGRYPELRGPQSNEANAPEAFIIGTLVSVLWAAGAAGSSWLIG